MAKDGKKGHLWVARLVVILGLVLSGLIAFSIYKEYHQKKQVEQQINDMKTEAAKVEKNNEQLSSEISYLESPDYQEEQAKDKLNLQSPGENVVVVEPGVITSKVAGINNQSDTNGQKLVIMVSNMQKWWNYFFKY